MDVIFLFAMVVGFLLIGVPIAVSLGLSSMLSTSETGRSKRSGSFDLRIPVKTTGGTWPFGLISSGRKTLNPLIPPKKISPSEARRNDAKLNS